MATYYSNSDPTVTSSLKTKTKSSNPDKAEAEKHLKNLISLLTEEEEPPKNILLIGRPAAGKSSLINLFRTALTNTYEEVSVPGNSEHGRNDSVTTHLQFLRNMGLSRSELSTFQMEHGLDVGFRLPSLVDMPGMDYYQSGNENILKYVIDGIVPEDTDITKKVSRIHFCKKQEREIDRIIFVISVMQDVPEKLLEEVMGTICYTDGQRRRIPYIVIFTHGDSVNENSGISETRINERKKIALGLLNLRNNSALNSHDVICYSDKDPLCEEEVWRYKNDYSKNKEALKALCRLCRRRRVVDNQHSVNWMTVVKDTFLDNVRRIDKCVLMKITRIVGFLIICYCLFQITVIRMISYTNE